MSADGQNKSERRVGDITIDNSDTPHVTWLIPVKNGMPYLPETLASIEAQTYRNWEVLIWDNGSTDGTLEELAKWIPDRLPGRVVSDQPMGLALSRAAQVEMADTEFCALIDADDVNLPDRLEKQVAYLVQHPEIAALGGQIHELDTHGVDHGLFYDVPTTHSGILQRMLYANPIAQPSVLFRKSAVMAIGNYRYIGPVNIEDYDLWMRLAAAGYQLANLSDVIVRYRVHEKSTTQDSIRNNRMSGKMRERFSDCAPELFKLTSEEADHLWKREIKPLLPMLCRLANVLDQLAPLPSGSHLETPEMAVAARMFLNPDDLAGRILFTLSGQRRLAGLRSWLIKQVCRRQRITLPDRLQSA